MKHILAVNPKLAAVLGEKTTHEIEVSVGKCMTISDAAGLVAVIQGPAKIIVKEAAE